MIAAERLRALARDLRRTMALPAGPAPAVALDDLLPHRPPFRLIDRLSAHDPTTGMLVAEWTVPAPDGLYAGHLPHLPLLPGFLLLEALAQTGLALWSLSARQDDPAARPPDARLVRVGHGEFLAPVFPGDRIVLAAWMIDRNDPVAVFAGQAQKAGGVAATTVLEAQLV